MRVVAATNADLAIWFGRGSSAGPVLPPARHSGHASASSGAGRDVPVLAAEFLRRFAKENGRKPLSLSEQAGKLLQSYGWPGNVRELENVIERCVVMAEPDETEITLDLLPEWVKGDEPSPL